MFIVKKERCRNERAEFVCAGDSSVKIKNMLKKINLENILYKTFLSGGVVIKIVFIGSVKFSEKLLKEVLRNSAVKVVGIVSKDDSSFNTDF